MLLVMSFDDLYIVHHGVVILLALHRVLSFRKSRCAVPAAGRYTCLTASYQYELTSRTCEMLAKGSLPLENR